ncbi:hypothetical protein F4861DRAFT_489452 [Xylaria intraflava]|nr:hypothetical protein F4861DRAFT_489452 [Xylaria intraflava]
MEDPLASHGETSSLHSQQPSARAEIKSQSNKAAPADTWVDDAPTCRICRGESTADEPLFFPCKCSGSIKYVHQNCLMEWLSHSQKKHCELCKTAFRFTKLYSPDMPKHLPLHIFIHHMAKYMLRNLLVWLRAALVTSVWLGSLPYLMRSVWSFAFWISDEGVSSTVALLNTQNASSVQVSSTVSVFVTGSTTCPAIPFLPTATTPASLANIVDDVRVATLKAVAKPQIMNTTQTWLRILFGLPAYPQVPSQDEFVHSTNITHLHRAAKVAISNSRQSLLSDVGFLNRITRNTTVNRIIIDVLEGQIITLLAIICFILIILVRDYVVQQQPEINMRAAFAAVEDAENDMAPPAPPINAPIPNPGLEDPDLEEHDQEMEGIADQGNDDHSMGNADDEHRSIRPPEPLPDVVRGPNLRQRTIAGMGRRPILNIPDQAQMSLASPSGSERSPLHDRGLFEAQSGLLREPSPLGGDGVGSHSQATISEYMRLYRAAGGDNNRLREIIQQEGLNEAQFRRFLLSHLLSPISSNVAEKASSDSSSWTWAGSDDEDDGTNALSGADKGKGRANHFADEIYEAPRSPASRPQAYDIAEMAGEIDEAPWSPILRPRAISDGPHPHETINPLANNSWSFANVPSDTFTHNVTEQTERAQDAGSNFAIPPLSIGTGLAFKSNEAPIEQTLAADNTSTSLHSDNASSVHSSPPNESGAAADTSNPDEGLPPNSPRPIPVDREEDPAVAQHDPDPDPRRVAPAPRPPNTIVGRVADFMYAGVPPADGDGANQEAVDIFGDNQNPPFVHGGHDAENDEEAETEADDDSDNDDERDAEQMAPDVVEAAVAAGLDPEAAEEAEDFDGIMELIGMRGPITGLFQNAVFCAFLVSTSIFIGVLVPYNIGRVTAWILANPTRIFRILFSAAKFAQDGALVALGYTFTFVFNILEAVRLILGANYGKTMLRALRLDTRQLTTGALDRIAGSFMSEMPFLSVNEMRNFSAVSHQALIALKSNMGRCILALGDVLAYIFSGNYSTKCLDVLDFLTTSISASIVFLSDIPNVGLNPGTWMFGLHSPEPSPPLDISLAYWGAQDRSWAILLGYASFTLVAALYLRRGTTLSTGQTAQEWEASIIDALNQASGIMKVIIIISIEMLVFPLYCGLLLDFALLPLFEHTTLKSRLLFTYNYPLTSIFVHWFIGTGYMFHFALFVSMCRKIMRKGVLYFIRDPDDPEFHPVRDVLERSVTTQLRKILFSAFVYGALVVICLGGVVWGLAITLPNVLPIHYTYNEPVLEFPVDLLFCNFLMPLAVKFFKPSDGLHVMYTWWFRLCAKMLRLSWFLFGERRIEEEGTLVRNDHLEPSRFDSWCNMLLRVDAGDGVAPQSWRDFFLGEDLMPTYKFTRDKISRLSVQKERLVDSGYLIPDGRFVRSPASDQARITKGRPVFTDVPERALKDDAMGQQETDLPSADKFQIVYVPPWFRTRISIFILSIWVFAAVTGVGSTIVPLIFGRRIFKVLVPAHIRTNDIYAFSIGVYVLSSASYLVFHLHSAIDKVREWTASIMNSVVDRHALQRVTRLAYRTSKLTYAYAMLLVVFPILITALVEMYVLIPLHTYMGTGDALRLDDGLEGHTVRIIQAWTLGILYLKLGSRALTLYGGRPAHAVRAVLRRGWLDPDVGVLTRAFVIPGFAASAVMLLMPPAFAWATLNWALDSTAKVSYEMQVSTYRLAYPLTALFWAGLLVLRRILRVFEGWQVRIRDEAYLMGERLHNFTGTAAKATGWRTSTRMQ